MMIHDDKSDKQRQIMLDTLREKEKIIDDAMREIRKREANQIRKKWFPRFLGLFLFLIFISIGIYLLSLRE